MGPTTDIDGFIEHWKHTGGSELANTQSFINGLCHLIGVEAPHGSRVDDAGNDYVFERRVFQDNGDGTRDFGRIDCYRRGSFILEAKQGSEADRAAAGRGEDDLDLFGQTANVRLKRGTARRGTPAWAKAMVQAKGQAERYAKALPVDHGWPPFLLVADIGYCIEVYADFTGTGKAYVQFPDRARYRIMLDDLCDEEVRERLKAIWTAPKSLDPAARSARVTREIADLLATVARRLEKRGHSAERTSGFLMRVLFTMFAEDSGLIPEESFTALLKAQRAHPEHLEHQLSALWTAMDNGEFSPALGVPLRKFNGYLFKDRTAVALEAEELEVLIRAAEHTWTEVEPAIFGTLLERALNPKERSKLGAHYTPRAYVERLVAPTIMEPLRADWNGVRVAAADLIEQGKTEDARTLVEVFHGTLAATKVLDPACGTGNFLYVAMARMKELEGEVLEFLVELGDHQYVAELTGHTITPENFLGIEINPRAAAIAQLVLWIGYLQWHFRVNGAGRAPPEPILRDIRTIENRDALITYASRKLVRDEHGRPVTRWDGETMKPHPVTGRMVPDETARAEVYRYEKPSAAVWPQADFIVGNPPFIGNKRMRERLGTEYVDALFKSYDTPQSIDFVMFWWENAAKLVQQRRFNQFGFITTNSLTQTFNRRVVERKLSGTKPLHITFCIADHPWIDEAGSAAVRVAMSVVARGHGRGRCVEVLQERDVPGDESLADAVGEIGANLCLAGGLLKSVKLKSNHGLASLGSTLIGQGFVVDEEAMRALLALEPNAKAIIRPYLSGRDFTGHNRRQFVIDAFGLEEATLRANFPQTYQHLMGTVFPQRQVNARLSYRDIWWIHGEPRSEIRSALAGLPHYITTTRTAKHRIFGLLPTEVLAESRLVAIALSDLFWFAVLGSRIHSVWAIAWGARQGVGNDLNYNVGECFDPFPFPADVPELLKSDIRAEASALDALRKQALAAHPDLTLTKLYNVLEALRAGQPLDDPAHDIHDRGLVSLIRQHHDAIDALVAKAYGWPADLSDEDILVRLVALNQERAAEEARGVIRWLRPEYQAPDYAAPITQRLDLGEAVAPLPDNVIAWPDKLPAQVSAIQSILATARAPMAAHDIARSFKGKRATTVRPVLDALTSLGMARRLGDGRYAA